MNLSLSYREFFLFFAFITLSLVPATLFSQSFDSNGIEMHQYVVKREFTTETGLPANGTNQLYQDHKGYLWAATYNGLVRYGGGEFKVYNTSTLKDLRSNRFITVAGDRAGRIWAGLEYGGVLMLDEEKDSTITYSLNEEESGPSAKITTFSFDFENNPWIGTSKGLSTIRNGKIQYLNHLGVKNISHLYHSKEHTFVLSEKKLLRLHNDGSLDKVIVELKDNVIYFENSSVEDFNHVVRLMDFHFVDNNLYLMSEAGLIKYRSEPEVVLKKEEAGQAALHGFLAYEDSFYIYGRDGMFETRSFQDDFIYYTRRNITDVLIDLEKSVWLTTTSNGIQQFISTPIYQGPEYNILNEQGITGILLGNNGSVFVGANCDGVYEFSGQDVNHYGAEDGFQNECVWSLMEEEDGTLWAGTWSGGVYYKSEQQGMFRKFEPAEFEDANVFLSIYKDKKGTIWFGTYNNGLFRFDGERTEAIKNINGETLSAIRMIYESNEGELYVATDQGIGKFSEEGIDILEEIDLLETSNFRTISQDAAGRFWFGSYGGGIVVHQPGKESVIITTKNGLYDNTISQLNFDEEGNVWMGGNLGISYIEHNQIEAFLNDETDQLQVSHLGVDQGMTIRETNGGFMPSSQMTPDGKLLIPTVQGVNVVDTNRMELNRQIPNVFVEEVEIDGERYPKNQIDSIPYSAQRVVFYYAGLSFKNPDNNQYEYMLEGFDKNWIPAGNNYQAVYSSIPHGEYNFLVRASNNDGLWNTNAASLSFRVVPPFWQTTWFYVGSIALFLLLIAGAFRHRLHSIRKNNRQLQKMVNERTKELSISNDELKGHIEDKNKLHSILAHDLRNPFTAILGYIELIKNEFKQKDDREHVEMMNMLLVSGRNTLNLLENLLDWSDTREGIGGLEANFDEVNITQLVKEAISMTEAQSAFKNIFVRNLIDEPHYVWADRNMILSVVRNLLSNAIKFSGHDSIIELSLEDRGDNVIVSIEDSGVGMTEDEQEKIFLPDNDGHQKVGTLGEKGIGMGLKLCKEFIDKHNQEIWVQSTPRKGSTFSFTLKKAPEWEEQQINQSEN